MWFNYKCIIYLFFTWYENDIQCVIILLGEWLSGSAGMGFTPHIITIAIGEVCILSHYYVQCFYSLYFRT